MRALLDVNVLIALLDSAHVHHIDAKNWISHHIAHGWASCPLTENGCVRILAQPMYKNRVAPAEAATLLRQATQTTHHMFWADGISLLDSAVANWQSILSSRQITDVYLLALAVKNKGRFVTFDRGVPLAAVAGAKPANLVVI